MWASHTGFVSVEAFDFNMLMGFLAMVIIGGLGSILHMRRNGRSWRKHDLDAAAE